MEGQGLVDQKWAEGNAEKLVTLASEVQANPQLPAPLRKCLLKSLRDKRAADKAAKLAKAKAAEAASDTPPPAPSADALLLAEMKTKRDRETCAYQVFMWHEGQGRKVAAKK